MTWWTVEFIYSGKGEGANRRVISALQVFKAVHKVQI